MPTTYSLIFQCYFCYLQLPRCKRQTGKNKTAGSSLLYTRGKKFWRRLCDNSLQDSCSGYMGVSMLDLIQSSSFQKRTGSSSNCHVFPYIVQELSSLESYIYQIYTSAKKDLVLGSILREANHKCTPLFQPRYKERHMVRDRNKLRSLEASTCLG